MVVNQFLFATPLAGSAHRRNLFPGIEGFTLLPKNYPGNNDFFA
jgi:hypothetical protein